MLATTPYIQTKGGELKPSPEGEGFLASRLQTMNKFLILMAAGSLLTLFGPNWFATGAGLIICVGTCIWGAKRAAHAIMKDD